MRGLSNVTCVLPKAEQHRFDVEACMAGVIQAGKARHDNLLISCRSVSCRRLSASVYRSLSNEIAGCACEAPW
jgi:hypothetical protein